jgi:hypothetical protein
MNRRLLPLLVALAAAALLVLAAPIAASGTAGEDGADGRALIGATRATVSRPAFDRGTRSTAPHDLGVVLLAVVAATGAAAAGDHADRRLGRRLSDVGERWRSLLLGAPPAAA